MAKLLPVLKQRFFDANGEPLAGGKLYSYIAGTSTPLATYTDQGGATPNANPVVLDANGEANVWVSGAYYKFILTDSADVVQLTVDDVTSFEDQVAEVAAYAAAAEASADAAALSEIAAELAETNAETAETAAELAETNAETAQAAAETARNAAQTAETAAELAETNAELAEANAELAETNAETAETAAELAQAAAETAKTAAELAETNAETAASAAEAAVSTHTGDTSDAHDASAISVAGGITGLAATDVQAALAEISGDVDSHLADTSDAHDASAISFSAVGTIAATDAQTAIAEVATDAATALSTHEADTTSIHGIADTSILVTTTGAQELADKTLTSPVIDTAVMDGQGSTPANPSAGYYKFYFKDSDGKPYYLNSAGSETQVGSGAASGAKNYITGGDGESGTIGTSYDDTTAVPVDGSGGTGGTSATTSSSPLTGTNSNTYTPGAGIGKGLALTVTMDREDFASIQTIELNYEIETYANYTDGDLQLWVIAPSGAVIQPAGYKILKVNGPAKMVATFQTESTGTAYKVLLHQSTATTTWGSIKYEIKCGSQTKALGSFVGNWATMTTAPTITSFGSVTSHVAESRRVGDTLQMRGRFVAGTVAAAAGYIGLGGYSIDTAKAGTAKGRRFGWLIRTTATETAIPIATHGPVALIYDGVSATGCALSIRVDLDDVMFKASNVNSLVVTGDSVYYELEVPILGWSSNMVLSTDTDTRVCAASVNRSSTQSINTASWTKVQFPNKSFDTHAAFDNVTNYRFTIPVPGYYRINAAIEFASNATGTRYVAVYKNGAIDKYLCFLPAGADAMNLAGSETVSAVAGDYFEIYVYQTSGGALNIGTTAGATYAMFERLTGPAQIAASEVINLRTSTSTTSISSSYATIIFTAKDYDTHGSYSTSTGLFTCPTAGKYRVYGQVWATATWSGGHQAIPAIRKNGTEVSKNMYRILANEGSRCFTVYDEISCVAGDTLAIAFLAEGTSLAIVTTDQTKTNYMTISKVS